MTVRRLRYLCTEIFKTLNNLNRPFMKDIFNFREVQNRPVRLQNILNLEIPRVNKVTLVKKV